ncbi:hypothetical protein C8R44DRAFT_379140 [Mycena epipterygia]|nr:hypothetical protein C8R44DRAFT_379140 [Mycena epipterygia]
MQHHNGIAIVGIAAQLPSGSASREDFDYVSFWDFLLKGGKAYEPLDKILPDFVQATPQVKVPAQGTFLKNVESFDNIALGISPRDARVIPYSARRLLDLSFQALLDSGIESRGRNIGCFMSGNRSLQGQGGIDAEGSFAWTSYSMANRISYALDLTGPSIHLDTACNSSLTALHLAIGAIEKGDCAAALVGAAQINREPFEWTTYGQGGVLSPDGMCKPFDQAADGFGRGEGALVVVLKPLEDALQHNDHIYSVILGTAINTTGSQRPLYVPNAVAQQQCIEAAYKRAGLKPSDADYIELHVTGTSVGDPIETNAAGRIFAADRSAAFGSVKGNIGHLEVAAFLASLVKACLIFEHGIIPPTVNFSNPTAAIDWKAFRANIPVVPTKLGCRSSSGKAIISLSGSGLGGTTGHVVLQAPPSPRLSLSQLSMAPVLFLIGGLSSTAVDQILQAVLKMEADQKTLYACAVSLSRRARQLPWRTYFMVPLSLRGAITPAVLIPNAPSPLVFVFSGQGPQHLEMGRQLFAEYPVFRNTILELDDVYRRVRGVSLMESTGLFALDESQPKSLLPDFGWPVTITLSAIAMIQMAMVDLLKSIGIVPDMMLGHSAGETAALYASGAGSKEMAMEIAIARGEAMTCTEGRHVGMAMLACDASRASELTARVTAEDAGVLELSCFNAPDSTAASGTTILLDKLVGLAKSEGLFAQRIRTMVPGHSSLMDCIKGDYSARMDDIFARYPGSHTPQIPVFSTCRDEPLVEAFTAQYFWDNCRNAVMFNDAISHSLNSSSPVFLEISCHAVLSSSISSRGVPDNRILCPMRRISAKKAPSTASTEPTVFLDTLGRLSLLGFNSLDLSGVYGPSTFRSKLIDHPLIARVISPPKPLSPKLLRSALNNQGPLASSNLRINKTSHPDLTEHVINGEPIFPATGFIELLLEAGANFLWDVEFMSILSLASTTPLEISLQRLGASWVVTTSMASREREHARGFLDKSNPNKLPPVIDFDKIWGQLPALDFSGFYPSLEPLVTYGPRFQRVVRCHGGPSEVIAEIEGPTRDEISEGYLLHPAIMDACLHVILHTDISKQHSKDVMYLPSRLDHFIFYRRKYGSGNWFSHIRLRRWTPDSRYYDVLVTDSSGSALCELRNLTVHKFTSAAPITVDRRFDLIFQPVAVNVAIPIIGPSFPERTDKREIQMLYDVLDSLAVEMISKSLAQDVVIGQDESRRRYLAFAHRALKNRKEINLSQETIHNLRQSWPQHFQLTSRIAAVHETVFETAQRAVDVLYSDDLMAKFYSKDSQTSNVCIGATQAFSRVLESLRKSGKKSIKILEVGAGTGLLTYHLIDELTQNSDLLVEYTVTDISYALVANLARNIPHGSVIPKAYDIGKDPDAQGIRSESYDVVVSLHVLHTAPSVRRCLAALWQLLVPGGCLLTVELDGTTWAETPGSVWHDCIFGSFPEWFGYSDGREHCIMAPAEWKEQLEAVDFTNVQTSVEDGASGRDFFFVAQKSLSRSDGISKHIDARYIYSYEFGKEIELQRRLKVLDTSASITIYLLALRGQDADAAVGLCVTLRKEVPPWDIRLSIFESSMDISNPIPLLSQHAGTFNSGENVVFFDRHGGIHVSRVALSPPPSISQTAAQHDGTKGVSGDPNYITVHSIHWASSVSGYDGFVGRVEQSRHSAFLVGDFVGGVVETSSVENLRVHVHSIISLAENPTVDVPTEILGDIVKSLIAFPATRSDTRIAVAIENQHLTRILTEHASDISRIPLVLADFRDLDIPQRLDILISDSSTYAKCPHLRRWVPRSGKIVLWDELLEAKLREDPSYIGRTLARIHKTIPSSEKQAPISSIPRGIDVQTSRCHAAPPFRTDRAYVLLGGIGGLGVDLAVWMYQRGAKHLVLTSRRGLESLDSVGDAMALAKVAYLQSQDDLNFRLERCDATNIDEMNYLVQSLPVPIAGCFQMTLVLSDTPFFTQTYDRFHGIHDSKLGVFETFSGQVEMGSLDFFVALSSISGLIGLPGQSNYSSACTALDGVLARYPNAFSLITPGILDAGYLDRANSKHIGKDILASMTAEVLWICLEDGLRKLDDGPFNQYIPDLDWNAVDDLFTLPVTCRHLISRKHGRSAVPNPHRPNEGEFLTHVLELLEVSLSDFDATQPLTIYGLDSISAAKLSSILRPYASISQMQLLGGVTWAEIEKEVRSAAPTDFQGESLLLDDNSAKDILLDILGVSPEDFSPHTPLNSYGLDSLGASRLATALRPFMVVTQMQLMGQTTWAELLQLVTHTRESLPDPTGQPLVEICGGSGTPLIILPGGNGSMGLFFGLRRHFEGPLWSIQITESTPLESFASLVGFWKQEICGKRPHGPYRFAAYSASTLLGVALTKLMEDCGEEVIQLTFIDHCPTLWTHEKSEALLREKTVEEFRDLSNESVLSMLRNDPATGIEAVMGYQAAIRGLPEAPLSTRTEVKITKAVMTLIFQFLQQFYPTTTAKSYSTFVEPYKTWLFSAKAPISVVIGEHGIVHSAPGGTWPDLGASRLAKPVKVHYLSGVGHYGLFKDPRFAPMLNL